MWKTLSKPFGFVSRLILCPHLDIRPSQEDAPTAVIKRIVLPVHGLALTYSQNEEARRKLVGGADKVRMCVCVCVSGCVWVWVGGLLHA